MYKCFDIFLLKNRKLKAIFLNKSLKQLFAMLYIGAHKVKDTTLF